MSKKTPCEELGYKPGDLFRCSTDIWLNKNPSIVMLESDDMTGIPWFSLVSGTEPSEGCRAQRGEVYFSDCERVHAISLCRVEPLLNVVADET
jgi:hypothetical protein